MAEETLIRPPETSPSHPAPPDAAIGESQGSQQSPSAAYQMFPVMYPPFFPGMFTLQNQEENEHGPGVYAIPQHPFMGPMGGYPPSALIPLKYKIPTRESSGVAAGEEQQGQEPRQPQQIGPQRQVVVRRFHFAFQLDLGLIIKLAAVVFLFSQEGSKQKFILLVFFASLVYLYQTGALAPLLRWIRRGAAVPPPQPPVRLENRLPAGHINRNDMPPEENPEGVIQNQNQNQNQGNEEPAVADENQPEPERRNGLNWWGIMREVQTFVVGFITSLLPGFQHND